jgi:uncharacterized protein involved in oxidation of intracellular sulfur
MKSILIVCNDAPYGDERLYNGLRLAVSLLKRDDTAVKVFLMGDAVGVARVGQKTPNGYYNLERMLKLIAHKGGVIGLCGSCLDARGLSEGPFPSGAHRSSMEELTEWTVETEKVIVF